MCVKLGHAKFQPFSARKILSYWGLNGEGGGKNVFNRKLAISQKWWEIRPRLLLITNRKWYLLSDEMEII